MDKKKLILTKLDFKKKDPTMVKNNKRKLL